MQANTPIVDFFRQLVVIAPRVMTSVSPHAAAELCWAFAKASFYHPQLFDMMCQHHISDASTWNTDGACKVIWAQSVMAAAHPALTDVALRVVHGSRQGLSASSVAPVLHSVATLALVSDLLLTDEQLQVCTGKFARQPSSSTQIHSHLVEFIRLLEMGCLMDVSPLLLRGV